MKTVVVLIAILCIFNQVKSITNVYTVVTVNKFNKQFSRSFGCANTSSEIIHGSYIHPIGYRDAAAILNQPYQFQVNTECGVRKRYFKIFGTNQDYKALLALSPSEVATQVDSQRLVSNMDLVVDWRYSTLRHGGNQQSIVAMWKWLSSFIQQLRKNNIYITIDANLLCYQIDSSPAFRMVTKTVSWIIRTYGRGTNYLDYESIFSRTKYEAEQHYRSECPRNPSLASFSKVAGTQVYIEKTLHTENKGYMGDITALADRAANEGIKVQKVFYDHLPTNVIAI